MTATKAPKIKAMYTEIGTSIDGSPLVVGWEFCRAGHHVANCTCTGGPTEPDYIAKMRGDGSTFQATPVIMPDAAATPAKASGAGDKRVPSGRKPKLPTCRSCGKAVTDDDADKNDDGTWTCHACQEAS